MFMIIADFSVQLPRRNHPDRLYFSLMKGRNSILILSYPTK